MATPGAGGSSNADAISEALINATCRLHQPRQAPGQSLHKHDNAAPGSNTHRPHADNAQSGSTLDEDLDGAFQAESDAIIQGLYEGNTENENGSDMRWMYRLMARVIQKQDAILSGIQQSRTSLNGGTAPAPNNSSAPSSSNGPAPGSDGPTPAASNGAGTAPNTDRTPRVSPHAPPKKTNWDQSKAMRLTILKLLNRKNYKLPLPTCPEHACVPTANDFGIRWEEKEKSLFNCIAANVIVDEFVRTRPCGRLTDTELDKLPDAEARKKTALLQASASSRRQTLYNNRLKVLDRFPEALKMHRNLIVQLGLAGTSSDEEDPSNSKVFLIKRRKELSSKVQILKSKLDLIYGLYFKGPGSRGSQVHARVASDKVSERPLNVEGLPVTCLNRAWYRSLSEPEREFYQFEPHNYVYDFPDQLFNVTHGRMPGDIEMSDEDDDIGGDDGGM
ncbi:hypothetical protein FRC07_000207 [Ceratobasidium sp. 392]|nr:hypothetical protein FRC07_000207 [Ceratobasidium sp. 392]